MITDEDRKKIRLANRKKPKVKRAWWKGGKNVIAKDDPETQVRRDLQYLTAGRFVRERPYHTGRPRDGETGRFLS
jgi:hypothetical protein